MVTLVKSDVCMASPSSVRAVEQWGSEDQSQGEKTVSVLRFIIHWTVPGRRQPLLEKLEGRGGSAGGIPKRMVHVQCGVLSVDPVRGLNVASRWSTTLAKFTSQSHSFMSMKQNLYKTLFDWLESARLGLLV